MQDLQSGTKINVNGNFGLGSWHEMFIEVEIGSDQATFGVDGTYTNVTLPAAVVSVTQLRFGKAGGNGSFYLDAVPNAIPEPATLGLMGLSGLMLLKRRRSA